MVDEIRGATLGAGLKLGGPHAWQGRDGFTFFQAGSEAGFIRMGVQQALRERTPGIAPTEGAER